MKVVLATICSLALMFGLIVGICSCEIMIDTNAWNDGICDCGGNFEFSNATHRKNGGNFYYYICDECGYVIKTHYQQTKSNKTYEVSAIVDEYDVTNNCSILVDWNGEAWFFDGELEIGRLVIIKFNDMGTADIYDDEIIEIIS